ncbi:MAG: hypothetical protein WKG52_12325 [Variovorax sp.]
MNSMVCGPAQSRYLNPSVAELNAPDLTGATGACGALETGHDGSRSGVQCRKPVGVVRALAVTISAGPVLPAGTT